MIQTLSHTAIYVDDQEAARAFYVDKLGFEVSTDTTMGGFRWLTISPKAQKNLEIILMPMSASPMMDGATVSQLRDLVARGVIGCGVLETDDCQGTYEALQERGIPLIFVTGYGDLDALPAPLRGVPLLRKPVDRTALADILGPIDLPPPVPGEGAR